MNANIPPAYAGIVKCDYALPDVLADSLMLSIQRSDSFRGGDIFAIPLTHISASSAFFLSFTRDAVKGHAEGDGDPAYALGMVMGHLPEGKVTLLGTSVKLSTSIIVRIDLDNSSVMEGLSR